MPITAMTGGSKSLFARLPFIRARQVRRFKGYPFLIETDATGKILNVIGKMRIITTQGIEGLIKDGRDIRTYKGRVLMIISLGSSEQKDWMIAAMNDEYDRIRRRLRIAVTATAPPVRTAITED